MLDLIIKNGSCFIDGNLQKLSIGISKGNIERIENNTTGYVERYELENCGHSPHTQYPKEISKKIQTFLISN